MGQYTKKVVKEAEEEDHSKGMMTSTLRCYFVFLVFILDAVLFNATQVPNFRAQWPQVRRLSRKEAEEVAGGFPPGVCEFLGTRKEHGAPPQQVLLQDFGGKQ